MLKPTPRQSRDKMSTPSWTELQSMGVHVHDIDSEAEDEEMFGHLQPWEAPYDYLQRKARRQNERDTTNEVFGSPRKRRRLQKLAKAVVENEKMLDALECGHHELPLVLRGVAARCS